jgi:hypothetical protein
VRALRLVGVDPFAVVAADTLGLDDARAFDGAHSHVFSQILQVLHSDQRLI